MDEPSPPEPAPRPPTWLLPPALALAAASLVFPPLAIPALAACLISAVTMVGARLALSVLGIAASLVGLALFIVRFGLPSIVAQGNHAAGERAVSVLREIGWAERIALEQGGFDRDGDGRAELAPLSELTGHALVPRVYGTGMEGAKAPVLRPDTYHPVGDGRSDPRFFRVGGYLFAVFLPKKNGGAALVEGDGIDGRERRFLAYAWPDAREGGVPAAKKERVFFLDEAETICDAENAAGYMGADQPPPFDSALSEARFDAQRCSPGRDGTPWRRWRKQR